MKTALGLLGSCSSGLLIGWLLFSQPVAQPMPAAPTETARPNRARPASPILAVSERKSPVTPKTPAPPSEYEKHKDLSDFREQILKVHERIMITNQLRQANRALETEIAALRRGVDMPTNVLEELEAADLESLHVISTRARKLVTARLLTPPEEIRSQYEWLARDGKGGVARILPRGKYDDFVTPRGGGAYWSFVRSSNSYNDEPDLSWEKDYYSSGFAGSNTGYFVDLGDQALGSLDADPNSPPRGLTSDEEAGWALLFSDSELRGRGRTRALKKILDKQPGVTARRIYIIDSATYLLRSILDGQHDVLVAFQQVHSDAYGRTLAWRILKSFDVERRR